MKATRHLRTGSSTDAFVPHLREGFAARYN